MSTPLECTELHLALDVHHSATAQARRGGDARRPSEAAVVELVHGQPVHLGQLLSLGIHHVDVAQDALVDPLLELAQPVARRVDGSLDIAGLDEVTPVLPGVKVALAKQVQQRSHVQ
jgi:hypothetical protein